MRFFDSFFCKVHCWYPFLDPPYCMKQYSASIQPDLGPTYCLFLLIMALGQMAQDDRVSSEQIWAEHYAQPAFSMLPLLVLKSDIISVQCLLLFRYKLSHVVFPNKLAFIFCGFLSRCKLLTLQAKRLSKFTTSYTCTVRIRRS